MVEVAIIGSDMQEVIGTAIAIYLLSNKAYVFHFVVKLICSISNRFFFLVYRCGPAH